jgi:predicted DNA-binding WGR domain protein
MSLADQLADAPHIRLVACDEARNIRRGYRIERSVDLFGFHIVDWSWGRIGTAGQSRLNSSCAACSFAETPLPRGSAWPTVPCPLRCDTYLVRN